MKKKNINISILYLNLITPKKYIIFSCFKIFNEYKYNSANIFWKNFTLLNYYLYPNFWIYINFY